MAVTSVSQVNQLSMGMSNVPGSLGKAAKALADAGVNIEGLCQVAAGVGADAMQIVHLVSDPGDTAKQILESSGFEVSEEKILAVHSSDSPGVVANVAGALGDAGINIENLYVSTPGDAKDTVLFLSVKSGDLAKATEAVQHLVA